MSYLLLQSLDYDERNMNIEYLTQPDFPEWVELLRQLSPQAAIVNAVDDWNRIIYYGKRIFIIKDNKKIIATASIVPEEKLNRPNGMAIHIEDVVVDKDCRWKGVGTALMTMVIKKVRDIYNPYKITLDCDNLTFDFYKKLGFEDRGIYARLE